MKKFPIWLACILTCMFALAVRAVPIASITAFASKTDGQTVFAADWNKIGDITTWINNTLLNTTTGLNCLSSKGDIYIYNGVNLQRLPAGANGTFLTADSTAANGATWGSFATLTTLTTKGDICGYNTGNARIPVGTDGQVLTADSTNALGVSYQTPTAVPKGTIVAWSPAAAGTSTIPSGWGLCDGTVQSGTQTPNLIGRFILGTRPSGSGATPSTNGYGALAVNADQGATSHNHAGSVTLTGSNVYASGAQSGVLGGTYSVTVSNNTTYVPASYTLVYICKL